MNRGTNIIHTNTVALCLITNKLSSENSPNSGRVERMFYDLRFDGLGSSILESSDIVIVTIQRSRWRVYLQRTQTQRCPGLLRVTRKQFDSLTGNIQRYTPITLYPTAPLYNIIIIYDTILRQKQNVKHEK